MRVPFSSYLMQRGSKRIRIIHHRAHRAHRGRREREREVPIFSKIVFLSVFSSVFSVTSVVSFLRSFRTSSKGPLSLNGCNLDKGCWATEQCMPDTCNA